MDKQTQGGGAGDPVQAMITREQAQRDQDSAANRYDTETKTYTIRNRSPGIRYVHTSDAAGRRSVARHLRPGESLTGEFNRGEFESLMSRAEDFEIKAGNVSAETSTSGAGQIAGAGAKVQAIDFDKASEEQLRAYIDLAGGKAPKKNASIEEVRDAARSAKADADKAKQ